VHGRRQSIQYYNITYTHRYYYINRYGHRGALHLIFPGHTKILLLYIYRALFLGILLLSFPAVGLIMYYINLRSTACIMSGLIRRMVSNAYNLTRAHPPSWFSSSSSLLLSARHVPFICTVARARAAVKLDLHLSCSFLRMRPSIHIVTTAI